MPFDSLNKPTMVVSDGAYLYMIPPFLQDNNHILTGIGLLPNIRLQNREYFESQAFRHLMRITVLNHKCHDIF